MVPSMSLGEIEIKILQMLKIAHDDLENQYGIDVYGLSERLHEYDIDYSSIGNNAPKIAKKLNLDVKKISGKYLNPLKTEGYIEYPLDAYVRITQKGIDYLDDMNKKEQPTHLQIINNPQNSPISQSGNATINITNNFLEELEKSINHSDLSPDEKQTWLQRIKEIGTNLVLSKAFEIAIKAITGSPS